MLKPIGPGQIQGIRFIQWRIACHSNSGLFLWSHRKGSLRKNRKLGTKLARQSVVPPSLLPLPFLLLVLALTPFSLFCSHPSQHRWDPYSYAVLDYLSAPFVCLLKTSKENVKMSTVCNKFLRLQTKYVCRKDTGYALERTACPLCKENLDSIQMQWSFAGSESKS